MRLRSRRARSAARCASSTTCGSPPSACAMCSRCWPTRASARTPDTRAEAREGAAGPARRDPRLRRAAAAGRGRSSQTLRDEDAGRAAPPRGRCARPGSGARRAPAARRLVARADRARDVPARASRPALRALHDVLARPRARGLPRPPGVRDRRAPRAHSGAPGARDPSRARARAARRGLRPARAQRRGRTAGGAGRPGGARARGRDRREPAAAQRGRGRAVPADAPRTRSPRRASRSTSPTRSCRSTARSPGPTSTTASCSSPRITTSRCWSARSSPRSSRRTSTSSS